MQQTDLIPWSLMICAAGNRKSWSRSSMMTGVCVFQTWPLIESSTETSVDSFPTQRAVAQPSMMYERITLRWSSCSITAISRNGKRFSRRHASSWNSSDKSWCEVMAFESSNRVRNFCVCWSSAMTWTAGKFMIWFCTKNSLAAKRHQNHPQITQILFITLRNLWIASCRGSAHHRD